MRARTKTQVAALPDRGDLVAYPSEPTPIRRGAYTWHPVQLSEEHALRAATSGGDIVVTAPNGEPIRLRYQHHVEHEDGNWTWVGRPQGASPGTEAIITFGEKAVFGTIPYGDGDTLSVTTAEGRTWLMETDRAVIAQLDNSRPRAPDHLLPPPIRGDAISASGSTTAAPATASTTATAANTVDMLVGYTAGFANRLGGQSQAGTRIAFLVDVTNQAYANSQIDAQVRLVRSMQVNYPDATSNQTTLYELTGVQCTGTSGLDCTTAPVPAALQPLHVARDQSGADLVSLVRVFNQEENGGCGIAWMIGGGQSPIDANDASWGTSVISDSNGTGPGSFPDNGFVCRDESFAHEISHNMGSAHDRDNADGDDNVLQANEYGRYPYSFGYKTGSGAGNFFTIMAYGDSGQIRYRIFSNPRVTFCGGFPCGVADQADNARSLSQTIPQVATFRAALTPTVANVPDDMNGDGRSDIFWRHPSSGSFATWLMNGTQIQQVINVPAKAPVGYSIVGTGDFNADGRTDMLWTSAALDLWMWTSTGGGFVTTKVGTYPAGWSPSGVGDANGDGRADILWRHPATGSFAYWVMNGVTATSVVNVPAKAPSAYRIVATRDFNGDGKVDLLWTSNARDLWLWTANAGGLFDTTLVGTYPAEWTPVGGGDVNTDGRADVLWRHPATGSFAYWLMNGAIATQAINVAAKAPATYRLVSTADFNGDGKADLLWTSAALDLWMWTGVGTSFVTTLVSTYPADWSPAG